MGGEVPVDVDGEVNLDRIMSFASQVLTLVGVLIGALTTYLATTSAERARHRWSLETRWDERKLSAYIEYMALVKETQRAARKAREAAAQSEARREALSDMEVAEQKRSLAFESLVLLAEPSAVTAAHKVNLLLWNNLHAATDPSWETVNGDELVHAMNNLHKYARIDLGIAGSGSDTTTVETTVP